MSEFTKGQLEQMISNAYSEYSRAAREFRIQAGKVRLIKKEIDLKKAKAYYNGEIVGKNQTERDAAEWAMFERELQDLEDEEHLEVLTFMEKEQAEIEVEYVRALLRIEELTQEI